MQVKLTIAETVTKLAADAITMYIGEDAFALLSKQSFLAVWDELYEACSWATIFQSSAFVVCWYQTYRAKYLPIIVKSENGNRLTGLLTMAVPISDNKQKDIIGAGKYEAEYQTWLSAIPDDESFIKTALLKIHQQFPDFNIHFRFIPSQAPLKWITEPNWKLRCALQSHKRPLMDMSDPDLSKMFRKTEFRNKLNRLKRLGELTFERITDKAQFSAILDELIIQYDFRQGAMFNVTQFRDEPLKVDFLMALFEKKLLHITVMKVQGQIFASVIAIAGRDWVHLGGINIHTPFNAKFYSPGFVHFLLLAQQLLKEGVSVFDLTPGGDAYKERLATTHDQVYELVVTSNFMYWAKRQLRKQYDKMLIQLGKWPMGVDVSRRKKLYLLKARISKARRTGILTTAIGQIKKLVQHPQEKLYVATPESLIGKDALPLNKNNLRDMLQFEAEGTRMTRWEFLEDAMRRFEVGQIAYTYCEEGRLLNCVWLNKGEETASSKTLNSIKAEDAAILKEIYFHPQGRDKLKPFLTTVAAEVTNDQNKGQVYAISFNNNKVLCQTLEVIGFKSLT